MNAIRDLKNSYELPDTMLLGATASLVIGAGILVAGVATGGLGLVAGGAVCGLIGLGVGLTGLIVGALKRYKSPDLKNPTQDSPTHKKESVDLQQNDMNKLVGGGVTKIRLKLLWILINALKMS